MAHQIGEKPGKGKYCCTKCNWSVVLDVVNAEFLTLSSF